MQICVDHIEGDEVSRVKLTLPVQDEMHQDRNSEDDAVPNCQLLNPYSNAVLIFRRLMLFWLINDGCLFLFTT